MLSSVCLLERHAGPRGTLARSLQVLVRLPPGAHPPSPPFRTPLRWQGYLVKRSINDPKPHWQRRWITLQGRTVYWFHGADKLKGQLELTEGTTVADYDGQDLQQRSSAKAREKAVEDHPFAFVVQTPEHKRVELAGLIMQVRVHPPPPPVLLPWR